MNLTPQPGEHAAIVGKTGSGKTTTAVQLITAIARSSPVFIVDSKGEEKFEQLPWSTVVDRPSRITLQGVEIYRPEGVLNTAGYLDSVLQQVYDARVSCYVYIDELAAVTRSINPGLGLQNLLQRGRHRVAGGRHVRVSTLMSTQRPSRVPFLCFSESTHYFVHRLQTTRDRKTMAEHLGDKTLEQALTGHQFWYYTHSLAAPRRMAFNLGAPARARQEA